MAASKGHLVAVVTGAAGELGQGIGRRLAEAGYTVVGFDRVVPDELPSGFTAWRTADQTSREAVEAAFEATGSDVGVPDVVVANAGYAKFGPWIDMEARTFERHVEVNLLGTFHVLQTSARLMAATGRGGSLVVIASSLAGVHADQVGPYSVTKGALLTLTRSMAAELGVHGVRVNAISPGVVETSMTDSMLTEPGVREDLMDRTPLRRLGTPDDVADAVAFLSSEEARWITGAAIAVDGGQSIYSQPQWMRQTRSEFNGPRWVRGLGG